MTSTIGFMSTQMYTDLKIYLCVGELPMYNYEAKDQHELLNEAPPPQAVGESVPDAQRLNKQ